MSFDVTTLALAKSYADQHGGSGGGEEEIFKIPVTITELEESADGESFKVEHTVTLAELDAAVKEGKTPIVLASFGGLTYALPLLYYYSGAYLFYIRVDGTSMSILVGWAGDEGDTPEESWQFMLTGIAAESVSYSNAALPSVTNVRGALDELVSKSHSPVYYIDLTGTYPNYTCPVSMDDIKAAYNSGYSLVCRCKMGAYTATLPLFVPMPAANTWIFSGSGALPSMGFPAQSFTIAITSNGVAAQQTLLNRRLKIVVGDKTYFYDGSKEVNVVMDGIMPTIGENGNWYIGSTDTGKPSRGLKGDKGDTPVKGTDYWTAADKAEIVNDTLAALPTWTGGAY